MRLERASVKRDAAHGEVVSPQGAAELMGYLRACADEDLRQLQCDESSHPCPLLRRLRGTPCGVFG